MLVPDEDAQKIAAMRKAAREARPSWKLTREQKLELLERYIDGEPLGEIAKVMGVRRQTVAYHLDRVAGVR